MSEQAAPASTTKRRPDFAPHRAVAGLVLLAILVVAAWLRFHALDASSLWNDEGTTWALIGRSFSQIAQDAAADIHPPGYYWLLKLWSAPFGRSAWAMRSFSAALGVLLTLVTYRLALYLPRRHGSPPLTAWLAAWLAALAPFQIYYAQEARMYMLLAVEGAGLFWALFALIKAEDAGRRAAGPALFFVLIGAAGLWTHYSFAILPTAAGLAYVWHLLAARARGGEGRALSRRFLRFAGLNVLMALLFAPWLPTAVERVLHWPQGGDPIATAEGLRLTLHMFVAGPIRSAPELAWPWLALAALLPPAGLWALRGHFTAPALGLWLLSPIALMFGLGLFSEAFLKFLLAAAPAWCLLTAAAPLAWEPSARRHGAATALIALLAAAAALILPGYYADPNARDNYAGVARYVSVLGDAQADLVLLNAPGQQDVWGYYNPGLPILRIPQQRPPDAEQTVAQLAAATADRRQVYALLWATDESDPDGIVEQWLDRHAFKGAESWQGNLRFVIYTLPAHLTCTTLDPAPAFGPAIVLAQQCQPETPQQVSPGEAATVALHWLAVIPPSASYKVSVQLLNTRNQVIAQHDSLPAGGSRPSDAWQPGEIVVDNHGLPIPPGTPPGAYRLIVALYDPDSGVRLPVAQTDHVELGTLEVIRPQRPIPVDVVSMPHHVNRTLGPVILAGYAAHAKDFSHAPQTPLRPGDTAHFTLYWQAPEPLPADWPPDLTFTLRLGDQSLEAPLAGGGYPTGQWQAGELVRAEFDLPFDGSATVPVLQVATDSVKLSPLPAP